ncbi:MAG: serine/threonine-protein kinase [Polyangiaceae bacterium]
MTSPLPPGTLVGNKYELLDVVGVGGSGTVYRARLQGQSRIMALKLMNAGLSDQQGEQARFAREAEVVKRLQHPHVVGLIDYGQHDGRPFLVQPLLEGQTLEEKIKHEGALEWMLTGTLATHVLKALEKAHSLGIAHRDIKPANIFVTHHVLGPVAQVLDFGLAKVVRGDGEAELQVTQIGAVIGTPRYMAPEQARGEGVGPAADIYACGLVLAEMLLGEPLVQGDKDIDIYVAQGSDAPHLLPPKILESPFASVVQRAVAKRLDVRYHEASQMLADVSVLVERLGGGSALPVEADMDATRMIDPATALPLSLPNETSEKLRNAFNVIAKKRASDPRMAAATSSAPPQPSPPQPSPPQPSAPQPSAPPQPSRPPQPSAPPRPSYAPPSGGDLAAPHSGGMSSHAPPSLAHSSHAPHSVAVSSHPPQSGHAQPWSGAPGPAPPNPPPMTFGGTVIDHAFDELPPSSGPPTAELPPMPGLDAALHAPSAPVAAPPPLAPVAEPLPSTVRDPTSHRSLRWAFAVIVLLTLVVAGLFGYLLFTPRGG